MRAFWWSGCVLLVVACGQTRRDPRPTSSAGTANAGGEGLGSSDGGKGGSAGESSGGDAQGGEAQGGATDEPDVTPATLEPLSPEEDVTERIVCPGPSSLAGFRFPENPQPPTVLATDPKSSSTFYAQLTSSLPSGEAGTFRAWLLRTDNGGDSWCPLDLPEPIRELVVSPADRRVLYASGVKHYLRSSDYGSTWQLGAAVADGHLRPHETRAETLYELGARPRRSSDGGATWEPLAGGKSAEEIAFADDGRELLYGVDRPCSVRRSIDGGMTWRTVPVSDECLTGSLQLGSGAMYFLERAAERMFVHHSRDNGKQWRRSEPLPFVGERLLLFRGDEVGVVYMSEGARLWRSADFGQTWERHLSVPDGGHVSGIGPRAGVFHADGARDRSVVTIDDGAKWTTTAVHRDGPVFTDRLVPGSVFIAGEHQLYRTTDGGRNYDSFPWPSVGAGPHRIFLSRYVVGAVFASDDRSAATLSGGDMTWAPWSLALQGGGNAAAFESLTADAVWTGVWYATVPGGAHVLRSGDAGNTFTELTASPPARSLLATASLSSRGVLYAVSGVDGATTLSRSDNEGSTWTDTCAPPAICPSAVAVHPTSPLILVGSAPGANKNAPAILMGSADGGVTWTRTEGVLRATWAMFFGNNQDGIAWGQTDYAYVSQDLGITWSRVAVPVAGQLAPDYSSSRGFFVNNGGLWHWDR